MKLHTSFVLLLSLMGCWAPLHIDGVPARTLPDYYRMPMRTVGMPLNYSQLTATTNGEERLGPGDLLNVTIPGLFANQGSVLPTIQVSVTNTGEVFLPLVGPVQVGGLDLTAVQKRINNAYVPQYLKDARVTAVVAERGTVTICVLGSVVNPGIYTLPRSSCDAAHALAAAGGLNPEADDVIEIHRRELPRLQDVNSTPVLDNYSTPVFNNRSTPVFDNHVNGTAGGSAYWTSSPISVTADDRSQVWPTARRAPSEILLASFGHSEPPTLETLAAGSQTIVRIPLRGLETRPVRPEEVVLGPNDVVVVPKKPQEVFYVVGQLSSVNRTRFTVGDKEREIGAGFLLPADREIDVITAVAMAGYIDPIDSPTTVTVHRRGPHGESLLILVDLIDARTDARENVLVQPGDIIYLNPDAPWYFRRVFDQVIVRALGVAIGRAISN